jgi:hypothetical protein
LIAIEGVSFQVGGSKTPGPLRLRRRPGVMLPGWGLKNQPSDEARPILVSIYDTSEKELSAEGEGGLSESVLLTVRLSIASTWKCE